ncbi:MAG: EamA family transporter [bacterium]
MNWIVASLLMYCSSVFYYLSLRYFQKKNINNTFLNWVSFFIYALAFGCYAFFTGIALKFPVKLLLLTSLAIFLFSYLGNSVSLLGTKTAPNPGYSLIIQKSYAIFTAIASVFLFDSKLTLKSIVSILIVVAFLIVMNYQKKSKKVGNNLWIIYSFAAFFAFGGLALYTKWLLNEGITVMSRTFYGAFIVMLFFGTELLLRIFIKKEKFVIKLNFKELILLILQGISLGLFNLFMNQAFTTAPNVGYVNIINGASITLITLLAAILYKDKLNLQKVVGIIGVTVGLIMLFI